MQLAFLNSSRACYACLTSFDAEVSMMLNMTRVLVSSFLKDTGGCKALGSLPFPRWSSTKGLLTSSLDIGRSENGVVGGGHWLVLPVTSSNSALFVQPDVQAILLYSFP